MKNRKGYSMVELLTTMMILGIMGVVGLNAFSKIRNRSKHYSQNKEPEPRQVYTAKVLDEREIYTPGTGITKYTAIDNNGDGKIDEVRTQLSYDKYRVDQVIPGHRGLETLFVRQN